MERRGIACGTAERPTVCTGDGIVMTLPFVNKQLDHEAVANNTKQIRASAFIEYSIFGKKNSYKE